MGKKARQQEASQDAPSTSNKSYKDTLRNLQIELVKLQRHFIKCDDKILILLEGRDAAGKDVTIKRIVQHLSPRETRVVALGKPSDRDRTSWYFQRYVPYLPAAQELVLFNRSWYNRAGVEKAYSAARNEMLARTHNPTAPWTLVRADDKRPARLNIIKDLLKRLHYKDKDKRLIRPDPRVVFPYDISNLENGQLSK